MAKIVGARVGKGIVVVSFKINGATHSLYFDMGTDENSIKDAIAEYELSLDAASSMIDSLMSDPTIDASSRVVSIKG